MIDAISLPVTARSAQAAVDSENPTPEASTSAEASPARDQLQVRRLQAYQFKFNFFYEKVIESSRGARVVEGDQSRSLIQQMYQRVSARFSLDLSFLQTFARQTGRVAALDEATFQEFVRAANNLSRMDQEGLNSFLTAVDTLFDSVESALGLGRTELDDFAEMVKSAARGFMRDVNAAIQELESENQQATRRFQARLQALLNPRNDDQGFIDELRKRLDELGIRGNEQEQFLRLAALILKFAEKNGDGEEVLNSLKRVLDSFNNEPAGEVAADVPKAVPARVVEMYEQTSVREEMRIEVQQQSIELLAA